MPMVSLSVNTIADLNLSDLTRDMKLLFSYLFDAQNTDVPSLQIPGVTRIKLSNEAFVIENR